MDLPTSYVAAFGAGTIAALLLLHRLLQRLIARRPVRADLLGGNRAFALREVGDVLGVFLIGAAVVHNNLDGQSWQHDLLWCGGFGVLGVVLLELTAWAGLRFLLGGRLGAALERGNLAAGVAAAAHYVAMGLFTSRAMAGRDVRSVSLALVFFALGVAAHQLLVLAFRALTTYSDDEQIEGENLAAAISYGGSSIAIAVVVARALEGDFVDWPTALSGFGILTACALCIYPIRQLLVQGLVLGARPSLRGGAIDEAIGRDRNVGVASLESVVYLGAALALASLS